MTTTYVQFSDATETKVIAIFGCAQDTDFYPNQGAIPATDPRYLEFINPAPTLATSAAAALAAGLTLALSGTLTLAATVFPTDSVTTAKLATVITTINANGSFPGGATEYPMKDASGAWHTLTVDQYKAVAGAIAAYVAPLDLIIDGNPLGATALPVASVSLTV